MVIFIAIIFINTILAIIGKDAFSFEFSFINHIIGVLYLLIMQLVMTINLFDKKEVLNFKNLTTKRPSQGISPFLIKKLINKKAKRNYYKDELIKL